MVFERLTEGITDTALNEKRLSMGSNCISTDKQEINVGVGQREQHVFVVGVDQGSVP